jgi:hypothetical protein
MNKVSCTTMCAEEVKATTSICVDILEVGKDKLSCQKLAQKIAINDNDIINALFKKGNPTIMNLTLD